MRDLPAAVAVAVAASTPAGDDPCTLSPFLGVPSAIPLDVTPFVGCETFGDSRPRSVQPSRILVRPSGPVVSRRDTHECTASEATTVTRALPWPCPSCAPGLGLHPTAWSTLSSTMLPAGLLLEPKVLSTHQRVPLHRSRQFTQGTHLMLSAHRGATGKSKHAANSQG